MNVERSDPRTAARSADGEFNERFLRFVDTCQVLALAADRRERPLAAIAASLAAVLPHPACAADFLLLRSVLVEFAAGALERERQAEKIVPLTRVQPPNGDLEGALMRCLRLRSPEPCATRESVQDLRAVRAMSLITSKCGEPDLTAASVAVAVGVSPKCLARLLHQRYGVGFRPALTRARLQAARSLLEQPLNSIKEVAAKAGYASTSQFDRDFKRACRVTPGEYRRKCLASVWRGNVEPHAP
jgi:AraC-like DNA-binding protein